MIGLRPKGSALYLERPRLLSMLPQEEGFVVWLEAPYGYGKSVLAMQWADALERDGWRVLWLSLQGRRARPTLARLLGLPAEAPWGGVKDTLERERTLLVLEDLEGREDLSALLRGVLGLLLLASRSPLPFPELPKLETERRLVHLTSDQLAFSLLESRELIADPVQADALWRRTRGWSLPLHFAALTGEAPERPTLIAGIRESLSAAAWREALFLAALPYLPEGSATAETTALARAGFVQVLEHGYRLHPLAAETLASAYRPEIHEAVGTHGDRLPVTLRGEAFRRVELFGELTALLDTVLTHTELNEDPQAIVEWDRLLPSPRSRNRRYNVAVAHSLLGNIEQERNGLLCLAEEVEKEAPQDALFMLGLLAYDLADHDLELALYASDLGASILPRVDDRPDYRFRHARDLFLNNAAWAYQQAGDFERAESFYLQALESMAADRPDRVITVANLAFLRWLGSGDLEGYIEATEAMLPHTEEVATYNLAFVHLELGRFKGLLGRREDSLRHFRLARQTGVNPTLVLEAEAEEAGLTGDSAAFSGLIAQAKLWAKPSLDRTILALWASSCCQQGRPNQALRLLGEDDAFEIRLVRALALHEIGHPEAAAALPEAPTSRQHLLRWYATRYRLDPDPAILDALIDLTLARERILPGLVLLDGLPRDRPDLSLPYPLREVLASGWGQAIDLRLEEIPPLELAVLGKLEVRVLDRVVELTDRQKEILVLLLLDRSREEIGAALWPEAPTKKMRNNLNVQLNLLRKVIEPWGRPTYLFEHGLRRTRADLWDLRAALEADDADEVVARYATPFAPGVDLPVVSDAAEVLRRDAIEVLYGAACLASDDRMEDDRARRFLECILDLDPIHEEALQRLLTRLVRRGRRREAMRRFRQFSRRLHEELGFEPLPETQAIVHPLA